MKPEALTPEDMTPEDPIIEIRAPYVDEVVAAEVAEALNIWFRWILGTRGDEMPQAFEAFGVDTADYAWSLEEDVDWEVGPHARALGPELRIGLQTMDTQLHMSGLLRRLGALSVTFLREGDL